MALTDLEKKLIAAVSPERLEALTLALVSIPSPTGQSRDAAEAYAEHLRRIGLDVAMTYEFPDSPNVVARLHGTGQGPTLQLAGHIDTIAMPHAAPYVTNGLIYGRGAADMKGALAAMAETAQVLITHGIGLKGALLLTAFGLHEAPVGHGEGLQALVRRGIKGDAAIVCEGGGHALPIAGKGMGIFEITVHRSGESIHELNRTPETPNPIFVANRLLTRLESLADELSKVDIPDVGPESLFIGIIEGGDFYNRVPVTARIIGTRRHAPERTFNEVRQQLQTLVDRIQAEDTSGQITIELSYIPVRDSFRIDPEEPIALIVRQAYKDLLGSDLPLVGISVVADAPILIREGGIPTVYHGPWSDRAHADTEYVALDELVRATRMYILCTLRFCGIESL